MAQRCPKKPYRPINNQHYNPEQLHHVHVVAKEAPRTHDTSDPQRIDAEHEHTAHSQRGLSAWLISIEPCDDVGIGNGLEDGEKWCVSPTSRVTAAPPSPCPSAPAFMPHTRTQPDNFALRPLKEPSTAPVESLVTGAPAPVLPCT